MELTGQVSSASTLFVSPNTLYYLALYGFVVVVRFFKVKKIVGTENWTLSSAKKVLYVGLETIYAASGLVVLLLVDLKEYVPFIIVIYFLLIYVSSQIESMEEKFSENAVFGAHLTILLIISSVTIWYFESLQKSQLNEQLAAQVEAKKKDAHNLKYDVAIPYRDFSLIRHLGSPFNDKKLVYQLQLEADNLDHAKRQAWQIFEERVKPFAKTGTFADLQNDNKIYIYKSDD